MYQFGFVIVSKIYDFLEGLVQFRDYGSGRLPGGIRLSRFKRLARGLDTAIDETSGQANQGN